MFRVVATRQDNEEEPVDDNEQAEKVHHLVGQPPCTISHALM